jgi:class 3 adenylate cyclase
MGDAVLLEFEDPAKACAALCELHARFPAAAIELGVPALPLHSGVHFGPVTIGPDGDVYGQT